MLRALGLLEERLEARLKLVNLGLPKPAANNRWRVRP